LSRNRDPFYLGSSPVHWQRAHRFADLWTSQGCQPGTHLRAVHYKLVVADDFKKPDGTHQLSVSRAAEANEHAIMMIDRSIVNY
jgi:hypothetical protein